jgi:D-glycero-alpha-D-manno-heptose-7-phosphate kinase
VRARAPIRICDNGGWTDTWFAGYGAVFNIAVSPYAEVRVEAFPRAPRQAPVHWIVENYGDEYDYDPASPGWGRHPLLEAAVRLTGLSEDIAMRIHLRSDAPPGASTGTSAAVTVALIGALSALRGNSPSPSQAAALAHRVETGLLGRQSGIQDQLAAAYGGINWIEMDAYPHAQVTRLPVRPPFAQELESRLSLVFLGQSHDSSRAHESVIAALQNAGPDCSQLAALRQTASLARQAVFAQDLSALGQAFRANTLAQENLHPALISAQAHQLIEIARRHGAAGWKVNGAGGQGGSLAVLGPPEPEQRSRMEEALLAGLPYSQIIPIRLDFEGLQVAELKGLSKKSL